MTNASLYQQHLDKLDTYLTDAIDRAGRKGVHLDGVLFHAGRERYYHSDDQPIHFRSGPHFMRYVPLHGPEHCVLARPGKRPLVVRVAPRDFWYELTAAPASYWQDAVDYHEVSSLSAVPTITGPLSRVAYVGNSPAAAAELSITDQLVEPEALMAPLAWHRGIKTEHEIELLTVAAQKGAAGHRVARKAFESGASEREIYWAFLEAADLLDQEVSFDPICALDEKISILHYQNKRGRDTAPGKVFMLDAGATHDGYCSDITRTWALDSASKLYRSLLASIDALERDLVGMVTPGRPYLEIHLEAHRRVSLLLAETGLVTTSAEEALETGVTQTFLPHGIGHHLGLQVHDLGGHQESIDGGRLAPPEEHSFLRNTRTLEVGHVVTIEPGIYFCGVLLDELRARPEQKIVDWKLVDELIPCGGVRIEDDVVCTNDGPMDLTRPLIQGPRGL